MARNRASHKPPLAFGQLGQTGEHACWQLSYINTLISELGYTQRSKQRVQLLHFNMLKPCYLLCWLAGNTSMK
jgi:hypothetical protein